MIFQTIGNLLLFLLLTTLSFYPIGYLFLGKNVKKLNGYEIISLSFAISIVFFVFLSVFLALINARNLFAFIIFGANIASIIKYKLQLLLPWKSLSKNYILLGLLFLGILVEGFITFPSGYLYKNGLLFWSSQGFDGLWYISLIEAVSKGMPPATPVFSGTNLQNYHYLVDILMGEYYRIYNFFSPLDLYFRFFPVFLSFLLGTSIFSFMSKWKNKAVGYWSVFFTYFVGSFGFVVTYLQSGKIFGGETAFWVSQLNTVVANPPHTSAMILLCSFLLSFYLYTKNKSKSWFLLSLLFGSIVSGFKVSGGGILLAGLGVAAFFQVIREKKIDYFIMFFVLLATNYITLYLISPKATSLLIFQPWWFIRTMVVEKLGLIDWELRRQTYLWVGRFTSYLRVIQLEGTALLIFIVGNLGVRILGFPVMFKNLIYFKRKIFKNPIDAFLISSAFVGFMVPMLFLQKGVAWVSVQFMQYVLLITGFYGAIFTYSILKKIKLVLLKLLFVLILLLLSTPTVIGNFVEFYGKPPNAIISNSEIEALTFLKANSDPNDVILTPPYNKYAKNDYKKNPLPIYTWFGTAYVSALTERNTFLNCEEQLLIMGYDVEERLTEVENFFSQENFVFNNKFLTNNNIKYIYIPTPRKYTLQEEENNLTKVFSNDEVNIYKVIQNEK
jgi:hypothetical protein